MDDSNDPVRSNDQQQPRLTAVAEKTLPAKCKPDSLVYCPTMDLVALASQDEQLHVFRLNGQKVFGGSFAGGDPYFDSDDEDDGKGEIRRVKWKDDGHLLAIACGDNTIRIMSSYSGKVVHHYPAREQGDPTSGESTEQTPKITCLGWGANFTDYKSMQHHLKDTTTTPFSLENVLSQESDPSKANLLKADLPRELAMLDIESSLPKLSTLPGTGSDDDVFSSRASVDAIFHSNKNSSDTVDVLVVGFDDGTIHLRIFDCFEIGSFDLGSPDPALKSCKPVLHAAHPISSMHALLVSSPNPESDTPPLRLLTLDLRFITNSGRYLSLLASKTTQLQNLLRYIGQVQRQIQLEWKNALELPARFMRSINDDLQEKCHCDFVTGIYHLVVTGDCFEPLKEFLVDIVSERGHKRWEKAVQTGYENVRRLTHECLLPALERSLVLLSRLTGLSKFHKLSGVLGLETKDLNAIVETVDCLYLLSHKVLIYANDELEQFLAFSKWLRHEIDIQSAEPMSQTLEELLEKSDMIDHQRTLKYIQGAMTKSALQDFIQPAPGLGIRPAPSTAGKWVPSEQGGSFYEEYKQLLAQQRKQHREAQNDGRLEIPKLNDLTSRLGIQCDKVFAHIALTQRRGILHRSPLALHADCDESVIDMTMRQDGANADHTCSVYVASKSVKSKHTFYIYRAVIDTVNGVSSTKTTSIAGVSLREGDIHQVQFVQDDIVMVLWSDASGSFYLLDFPFMSSASKASTDASDEDVAFSLNYVDIDSKSITSVFKVPSTAMINLSAGSTDAVRIRHAFESTGPKCRPIRIDVNGREGRRVVCVLYGEGLRYEVLDLDNEVVEDEDEGEEEGGTMSE
ncbi:anaphase-promoting complex component Cut20/Apc4, putative [Paecilomyces variotii No. 5]|uniref:Anaphase-promoting complex subunit 4 n=1 Tax=Byssochlamys spectabilis (strain No. 5 / NBRC 109023) TaxID=1356009 RepID=V5GD79_BYSSN|nr:anaphase-promoting complex component Cut20/Apc4, putative [Paecilomyces variotii No. 5]